MPPLGHVPRVWRNKQTLYSINLHLPIFIDFCNMHPTSSCCSVDLHQADQYDGGYGNRWGAFWVEVPLMSLTNEAAHRLPISWEA